MKHKFEVGDRVVAAYSWSQSGYPGIHKGDTGRFLGYSRLGQGVAKVGWDRYSKGWHDCGGLCKYGYGFNVPEDVIELDETPLVEISVEDLL